MNNFHDLIVNRRSIRRYTSEEIAPEDVKTILEAALMAPTSKSCRAWHFIVVEDTEKLNLLGKCKPTGTLPIDNCSLAIVVAVNVEKSEAWIEDASIAATYMQLQAEDLGLGSCWVHVRGRYHESDLESEVYVQNLLEMPDNIMPVCIITLGHKDEERKPQNTDKLLWERVHIGTWKEL